MANDPLNPDLGGPRDASRLNASVERRFENPLDRVEFQERALSESRKGDNMAKFAQAAATLGPIAGQIIRGIGDQNLLDEVSKQNEAINGKVKDINAQESVLQQQIDRAGSIQADLQTKGAGQISKEDQDFLQGFKNNFQKLQQRSEQLGIKRTELEAKRRTVLSQAISERPWLSRELQTQFSLMAGGPQPGTTQTSAATDRTAAARLQIAQKMFGKTTLSSDEFLQVQAYEQLQARQAMEPMTTAGIQNIMGTKASIRIDSLIKNAHLEYQSNGFVSGNDFKVQLNQQRSAYVNEIDQRILEAQKQGIFVGADTKKALIESFDKQAENIVTWADENDFDSRLESMNKAQEQLLLNGNYGKSKLLAPIVTSMGPSGGNAVSIGMQKIYGNTGEAQALASMAGLGPEASLDQIANTYVEAVADVANKDSLIPPGYEAFHAYIATQVMNSGTPEEVGEVVPVKHATALSQAASKMTEVSDTSAVVKNFNDVKKLNNYSLPKNSRAREIMTGTITDISARAKSAMVDKVQEGYRLYRDGDTVELRKTFGMTEALQEQRAAAGLPAGSITRSGVGDVLREIVSLKNNPAARDIFDESGDEWFESLLEIQEEQLRLLSGDTPE